MDDERGCQFCYYEAFDGKAYPCSMCIRGEERTDKFEPKGRQTKQTEPCDGCYYQKYGTTADCELCRRDKGDNYKTQTEPTTEDCLIAQLGDEHCEACSQTDCSWK